MNLFVYFDMKLKNIKIKIFNFWFKKNRPINILNTEQTIDKIINEKLSVSRYGDGELRIAFEEYSIGFQKYDYKLSKKLREVFNNNDDRLLICLPYTLYDTSHMVEKSKWFWEDLFIERRKEIYKKIKKSKIIFGDSLFSRIYIDYLDKEYSAKLFKKIRLIWENKDIVIVEGCATKLGIGNDLLSNAKSISRILCPSEDAFKSYDKILNSCIVNCKDKLVLIALGPTATVLAHDLSNHGIRAIDIGHIDVEYEWFLLKTDKKVKIDGKYVNEIEKGKDNIYFNIQQYKDKILDII